MWEVHSKRTSPPPDVFTYSFSAGVRGRIASTFRYLVRGFHGDNHEYGFPAFLKRMAPLLERNYGGMASGGQVTISMDFISDLTSQYALRHLFGCPHEHVVDYIELGLIHVTHLVGTEGAEQINQILRQEGIGYELTLPVVEKRGQHWEVLRYSQAIKKTDEVMHQTVVRPALGLLADPRFAVANKEMLTSFDHYRHGDFADAITLCGAAFESVLKTICTERVANACARHGRAIRSHQRDDRQGRDEEVAR